MTRSIFPSVDPAVADSRGEYQKGVGAARDLLHALAARAAAMKQAATSKTASPERRGPPLIDGRGRRMGRGAFVAASALRLVGTRPPL
ncbi:hypothetical protein ACW9FF_12515 [Ralstonia mannitolilytica]